MGSARAVSQVHEGMNGNLLCVIYFCLHRSFAVMVANVSRKSMCVRHLDSRTCVFVDYFSFVVMLGAKSDISFVLNASHILTRYAFSFIGKMIKKTAA